MKKSEQLPIFNVEEPDAFSVLESLISKTGTTETTGPVFSVSTRMPLIEFCTLEAICKHSGQSKNKITNQMLKACFERLQEELPDEDIRAIHAIRNQMISDLLDSSEQLRDSNETI